MSRLFKVNVGCGSTPTPGFVNLDNSLTVRLARRRRLLSALRAIRLLQQSQLEFARTARETGIVWAHATRLPLPDASCEIVYSSHMLEHLHRDEAVEFLREARRVLAPGGWLRVVVPDLARLVHEYVQGGDADWLIESTLLAPRARPRSWARLRAFVVGNRDHAWMYDQHSLRRCVELAGFAEVTALPAGTTRIPDPGALNLREREGESLYVEAIRS